MHALLLLLLLLLLLAPWVEQEAAATSLPLGLLAVVASPPHKLRVSRKMPYVREMDEKLRHDLRACACMHVKVAHTETSIKRPM